MVGWDYDSAPAFVPITDSDLNHAGLFIDFSPAYLFDDAIDNPACLVPIGVRRC